MHEIDRAEDRWGRFLAPFRRVTSQGAFIPEIDGLRFVAIFSVLLFHLDAYLTVKQRVAYPIPPQDSLISLLLRQGHYGVQLFFVISGFILALPFAEAELLGSRPVSLRRYFTRRLTRLEPPYLINLTLCSLGILALRRLAWRALLAHLLASAIYCHFLFYREVSAINSVAWSLEVEVQFYLLVPLLSRVFAIRQTLVRRGVLVAAIILSPLLFSGSTFLRGLTIFGFLQYFLAGFLLADLFLVSWRRRPTRSALWDLAGLAGWGGFLSLAALGLKLEMALPFCVLLAYVSAFRGRLANRVFCNRWLSTIGGMCYTLYLYHFQIISFAGRATRRLPSSQVYTVDLLVQAVIIVPLVLVASALLFRFFERPFMQRDWISRLMSRRPFVELLAARRSMTRAVARLRRPMN